MSIRSTTGCLLSLAGYVALASPLRAQAPCERQFASQRLITTSADGADSVFAADLDGDGDLDVLSASFSDAKIAWYENTDGLGAFGSQRVITTAADSAFTVFAADVDGDGDIDVLSASYSDDKIAWYENTDGLGTFGSQRVITTATDGAISVFAADLDGDGDADVLSASFFDDKIAWYQNETDCNGNGVNDGCDLADGTSLDCNGNGRPDECDIADGTSGDCDGNGVPDECETDCNANGVRDDCDIASGVSLDANGNGVPDECDIPPTVGDDVCWNGSTNIGVPCGTDADCTTGVCGLKSRYITIIPPPGVSVALQVTIVDMPLDPARVGEVWWAGPEGSINNPPLPALRGAQLECITSTHHSQVWTDGFLHLYGTAVVPGARYEVRTCQSDGSNCSAPRLVATGTWGDVVAPFGGGAQPNFEDILATVRKFTVSTLAPDTPRTDLRGPGAPNTPNTPDRVNNLSDINSAVGAFLGFPYPFSVEACPSAE